MVTKKQYLDYFADFIRKNLGIEFTEANYFQLEARLSEIIKQLGLPSIEDLYEKSQKNMLHSVKMMILDVATNNETSFFRDKSVFDTFQAQILPKLPDRLNILSAACSTGQEVYSLAILLNEAKSTRTQLSPAITAVDFSERVLNYAKKGIYTQLEIQRGLPAPFMVKYFDYVKDDQNQMPLWAAKSELKNLTRFSTINLIEPFKFPINFDVIFCRNVLIYQTVERKKMIVQRLISYLKPGGYLILGVGESMFGITDELTPESYGNITFYVKSLEKPLAK